MSFQKICTNNLGVFSFRKHLLDIRHCCQNFIISSDCLKTPGIALLSSHSYRSGYGVGGAAGLHQGLQTPMAGVWAQEWTPVPTSLGVSHPACVCACVFSVHIIHTLAPGSNLIAGEPSSLSYLTQALFNTKFTRNSGFLSERGKAVQHSLVLYVYI